MFVLLRLPPSQEACPSTQVIPECPKTVAGDREVVYSGGALRGSKLRSRESLRWRQNEILNELSE